jgi:GNAT superfamily N-acetyltransferase
MLDTLAEIYTQAYTGERYDSNPAVYGRDAFIERTTRQASEPGFSLVVGTVDNDIAGYAFGVHDQAGQWLPGESDPVPPQQVVDSPRFFVVELIVRAPYRSRGYARRLIDALLDDRPEPYATLTTRPGGFAESMYQRWGWQKLCTLAYTSAVTFDVMLLRLGSGHRSA